MGFSWAEKAVIWLLIGAVVVGAVVFALRQGTFGGAFGHDVSAGRRAGGDSGKAVLEGQEPARPKPTIRVHVAGCVVLPGVHELQSDSRVTDAVNAAGGPTPQADLNGLNLAQKLKDGQKIVVPARQTPGPKTGSGPPVGRDTAAGSGGNARGTGAASPRGEEGGVPEAGPINLNEADEALLDSLPGIGPSLAKRIIRYREEHGGFSSIDDLLQVPGIGPKKLEELRDLVTVD